ncbi:hypothetical protein QVD17_00147 [Tagetes erecta]|uniref:Uncharacterized protein n=1 Tax=Tagetes erecta TaxID=13708 RepID=A0AAD8L427_TARER|nr:hypothetical protein QVD17_00147 [Tagetes erecta]
MLHSTPLKEASVPAGTSVRSLALIPSVTVQCNRTMILSALAAGTPSGASPHARGFLCNRGYEIGNRDPRDFEIKRLKKRVRDLKAMSTWKETELEKPVRDELTRDEEHPTNNNTIYDSLPVYDVYEDEEWYSWFTDGVIERLEGKVVKE